MQRRKVVVPLDGTDFSTRVLPYIQRLLPPDHFTLILARISPDPLLLSPPMPTLMGEAPFVPVEMAWVGRPAEEPARVTEAQIALQDRLEAEMAPALQTLRAAGYDVTFQLRFGNLAEECARLVTQEGADLVAMSTHGRSGLNRLVMGSWAEEMLQRSPVPVLLVRPEATERQTTPLGRRLIDGEPPSIIVATDGSPVSSGTVRVAGEVARALTAPVTLLVSLQDRDTLDQGRAFLSQARDGLGQQPGPVDCRPLVGRTDERLLAHLEAEPGDLLVVGPFRSQSMTDPLMVDRAAARLLQYAPTSVLLVKGIRPSVRELLLLTGVEDDHVVEAGCVLAERLGASLTLLHVVPLASAPYLPDGEEGEIPLDAVLTQQSPLADFLERALMRLDRIGLGADRLILRRGGVGAQVLATARERHADLIVLGSRDDPGHYPRSLAAYVTRNAPASVLLLRPG